MGGNNWRQQPQYKPGVERADQEVGVVDAVEFLLGGMPFGLGRQVNAFGSTDFERHDLNDMIDLVEQAQPEHLELASKALWDAHQSISDAAKELKAHIEAVDWEGKAAGDFRVWATGLVGWSHELADFADKAATQISAAGMGLASVKKSMPPRDPRPRAERKLPTQLPKAKQVAGNPDYVVAKKAEQDRQEAINQMNKLASYYAVSAGTLKAEEGPQPYKPMPPVGIPKPTMTGSDDRTGTKRDVPTHAASVDAGAMHHHPQATSADAPPAAHVSPVHDVHQPVPGPNHPVGTEINTVGTLPPQHSAVPHAGPAPTMPTTGGGSQPTLPVTTGPVAPPVLPSVGRSTGYGPSGRLPMSSQGRTGPSGSAGGRVPQNPEGQTGRAATGGRGPQGPMGQAVRAMGRTSTSAGQSAVRGPAQQAGRSSLGRGITGGTPGTANAPAAGPMSAARNGVVGGKPVAGRAPGASSSSRVPRGMVVGAEEQVTTGEPRSALGRRGVVGAPAATAQPGTDQSVPRSAANPEGVIGRPRDNGASASKASEAGGGATGLGRNAVGDRQGPTGGTGRAARPTEKDQHRSSQKQRRDVPQKSD
ncbi:hypothetical protein [Streptomyces sp. AF1A]|jgi:hypothetical protein|uniref:hypothetical protein n=1 Tax=Streptomyces sp. AF1A TaxID=3394350 RepID=UPI0039BD7DBC